MKKLFALLLSCVMVTSAFASCGSNNKDKDKDEKDEKSVSDSKDKDNKDSEDDESSDENSEDSDDESSDESSEDSEDKDSKKSKDESSEESKSDDKKKDSSSKSSGKKISSDICGEWTTDEIEAMNLVMNFTEDGILKMSMDYSEIMHFEGDKLNMSGMEMDYTFDGTTINASYMDQSLMVLERADGSKDDSTIDGTYKLSGGTMSDSLTTSLSSQIGDADILFVIDGESLYFNMDLGSYSINGDEITIDEIANLGIDITEDATCKFEINGDELTLTPKNGGTATVFHRP